MAIFRLELVLISLISLEMAEIKKTTTKKKTCLDYLYRHIHINSYKPGVPFVGHRQTE